MNSNANVGWMNAWSGRSRPSRAAGVLLERALKAAPDVRADRIARAKRLVADKNYPPREVLQRVAVLLASRLAGDAA